MIVIDRYHNIPVFSEVCSHCKYLKTNKPPGVRVCSAFLKEIPLEIWLGKNLHTKLFEGQTGTFVFKPFNK